MHLEYVRHRWYIHPPSTQLFIYSSNSLVLLFFGVMIIVYVYADAMAKSQPPETADELTKRKFQDMYTVWWGYAKFGVMTCICTTAVGCIYAALAAQLLFSFKYPDYYVEVNGRSSWTDYDSPTGHLSMFFTYVCITVAFIVIGCCGVGTAARYALEDFMIQEDYYDNRIKCIDTSNQSNSDDNTVTAFDADASQSRNDESPIDKNNRDINLYLKYLEDCHCYVDYLIAYKRYEKALEIVNMMGKLERRMTAMVKSEYKENEPMGQEMIPLIRWLERKCEKNTESKFGMLLNTAFFNFFCNTCRAPRLAKYLIIHNSHSIGKKTHPAE